MAPTGDRSRADPAVAIEAGTSATVESGDKQVCWCASTLGKVGLGVLILAGVGQVMGGLFDINHPLHGPAAMIGPSQARPSICGMTNRIQPAASDGANRPAA